jgi:uncharacterized Zn finger protein (UPF0148 family)
MQASLIFLFIAAASAVGALISISYRKRILRKIALQTQQTATPDDPLEETEQSQETAPEERLKCSKCGTENSDGNLFCNQCGAKLEIASSPSTPSTMSTSEVIDGIIEKNKTELALRGQQKEETPQRSLDLDGEILKTVVENLRRATVTGKITVDREFQTATGAKVNAHLEANVNNNERDGSQEKPKTQAPTVTERPIED